MNQSRRPGRPQDEWKFGVKVSKPRHAWTYCYTLCVSLSLSLSLSLSIYIYIYLCVCVCVVCSDCVVTSLTFAATLLRNIDVFVHPFPRFPECCCFAPYMYLLHVSGCRQEQICGTRPISTSFPWLLSLLVSASMFIDRDLFSAASDCTPTPGGGVL